MTTRSGRSYKEERNTYTMAEGLAEVLRTLLEDQQRRDEELAAERRRRDEEAVR